jgi:hypothetical protein
MLAPHRQTLALALFQVAPAYDRPPGLAGKNSPARFHLVVNIRNGNNPCEQADQLLLSSQGPRVQILTITSNMPAAGKYKARARTRIVEDRLCCSRRVVLISPGNQNSEYAVTPCDSFFNNFAIIRSARDDCDAPFERVEFAYATLPADTNHLIAPGKRVLYHVLA